MTRTRVCSASSRICACLTFHNSAGLWVSGALFQFKFFTHRKLVRESANTFERQGANISESKHSFFPAMVKIVMEILYFSAIWRILREWNSIYSAQLCFIHIVISIIAGKFLILDIAKFALWRFSCSLFLGIHRFSKINFISCELFSIGAENPHVNKLNDNQANSWFTVKKMRRIRSTCYWSVTLMGNNILINVQLRSRSVVR